MGAEKPPLTGCHLTQADPAQADTPQSDEVQPGDFAEVGGEARVGAFDRQSQLAPLRARAAHTHLGVRQAIAFVAQRALDR